MSAAADIANGSVHLPAEPKLDGAAFDDATVDTPISVGESSDASETSKLRMILQLVKKCFGVSDIANMRLSLPSVLLAPVPNLEYWSYTDRPDILASVNDSPDPFDRMLSVLRFVFSKDLKFIRGGVCKPYNSVLGEHFRCHYRVPALPNPPEPQFVPKSYLHIPTPAARSEGSSLRSFGSWKSGQREKPASISQLSSQLENVVIMEDGLELNGEEAQIVFITEQVSHHPPMSSYYYEVVDRGIQLSGVDQIAARLSGASVRIAPGDKNKGLFIKLTSGPGEGEEYHVTHPIAAVNGLLTMRLYASITDSVIVTCRGGKDGKLLRAIIEYKDEGWIGKPQRAVEGVIHTYDPDSVEQEEWRKVKHVPLDRHLARFEGAWDKKINWRRASESDWRPLIDLSTLSLVPKIVRPLPEQLHNESRRFWKDVTENLNKKNYNEATACKLRIEQSQRDIAAERKRKGVHFTPVYFDKDIEDGRSRLNDDGRKAIMEEIERARTGSRSASR
ncbi:hypothetical protein DACRYDRAFT_23887 [Dacryopinax primogenitus]|uniref:Oxysterol-binding protein n=1 Tax=Dacryopinax primogenitus (strain DJM 731) TaxID=1858805 RepID=M5G0D8_DACPD|nr:uncharacterized protein DACRYDRAFT_23887 [Dacryopinax primogenitus]EJT99296.1 hypothetical protein DACRYDRAFT_23887 [Dacryopinax primogenitus]